ncbi:MAG: thiamine phosphate synthase [Thermodesulfobacteriota bacterium]
MNPLIEVLRFYFITDDNAPAFSPIDQVRAAIQGGATLIQYRNKFYSEAFLPEVIQIRDLCRQKGIPLVINDHIDLAEAIGADGVHLGQSDASPALARQRLEPEAIVGTSVSDLTELAATDLGPCDYIGTGPVFATGTKPDAKAVKGPAGFQEIADKAPVPVVAIGGITAENARACFEHGAAGVAVISYISRAKNPIENARKLGDVCRGGFGSEPRV